MSVINTGNFAKLLWPGINTVWGLNYDEHSMQYKDLFDEFGSKMHREEDVEVTGFGLAPVKLQGAATTYDTHSQQTVSTYRHVAYGLGFIVTREEMEDDLYMKRGAERAQALAFSFRQTRENVGANIYNRAFNSTYTFGDGKELIATDHPTLTGSQSNELAVAADLSEVAIEDLAIQIMNANNSRGLKISIKPKSLHVSTSDVFEAERILKSAQQNDTANNAINAIRSMGMFPGGVKVNQYFTDSNAWFIRTTAPNGMKWYDRIKTEFSDDTDFDTDNLKYKGYMRFSAGCSDWRAIYGSAGA